MLETSQTIMRVVALSVFTALFAGLWANDHPEGTMAIKHQPIGDPIARMLYGDESQVVEKTEVPVQGLAIASPVVAPAVPMPQAITAETHITESPVVAIQIGNVRKTFNVDSDQLEITEEAIAAHVSQLPLGIAAGDYRIVDSLGGVGWLRVRTTSTDVAHNAQPLISTTVNQQSVQFIKVVKTASR